MDYRDNLKKERKRLKETVYRFIIRVRQLKFCKEVGEGMIHGLIRGINWFFGGAPRKCWKGRAGEMSGCQLAE